MRNILLAIVIGLLPVSAKAEPSGNQKPNKFTRSSKPLPLKGAAQTSPCAIYGPGFVRVEGTETCVQIGGTISIGAGTSTGR